ncbi:photosynthetic reaction center cytochrome PufC [Rhodovibrio salinarum]|uniref:Photosynthetic reaction center cytochrome c subunit n=1 Tax=Rhodovibrio salinarum TaxID=1087 RepID=A0A934UYT0_9PROT|nr:photosynthetic reaction center cytochrome PufC [Rhodovibrio salinarum]MBK1696342.1 photosynthetic reaction center cytochrome c subunit [Rhodovibrio salinarum]
MAWSYKKSLALVSLGVAVALSGCEDPPKDSVQRGYRGVALEQNYNPEDFATLIQQNQVPEPGTPAPEGGQKASEVYQNVEVLGDLNQAQFTRLMNAITQWVAPEQGCGYCHNLAQGFAYEDVYTKQVSRQMLRMTRDINENWEDHVGATGVTCFTCHRGNNLPEYVWWENADDPRSTNNMLAGWRPDGQNAPNTEVGYTAMPGNPFERYLVGEGDLTQMIRVQGGQALPDPQSTDSIQSTEATYSLMMHQSEALGVNCTYCHNSRSWSDWDQSPPQRVTAWHGQRMTQALNNEHVIPTTEFLPPERLGPTGDAPKINCTTCHQGVYKPLFGANMVKDYPGLDPNLSRDEAAQLRDELGPDHGANYGLQPRIGSENAEPAVDNRF